MIPNHLEVPLFSLWQSARTDLLVIDGQLFLESYGRVQIRNQAVPDWSYIN